jgi:hypothetical protein
VDERAESVATNTLNDRTATRVCYHSHHVMSGWAIKRGAREVPIPDEATLRKWADEGRFNPSDLIFHPDLQRWLYAQDVLEIRGAFQRTGVATSSPVLTSSTSIPDTQTRQAAPSEFIIRQNGQDFRAPDMPTVRAWAKEGRILHDSYVFHPVLNRWSYARELAELDDFFKKTPTNISNLALSYRQLVLWVGAQIIISIGLLVFNSLSVILVPALVATTIALAFYAYRTAEALGSSSAPLWAVAMLIPCINIVTLLILSSKATDVCRANGVPVGFLGPRV